MQVFPNPEEGKGTWAMAFQAGDAQVYALLPYELDCSICAMLANTSPIMQPPNRQQQV